MAERVYYNKIKLQKYDKDKDKTVYICRYKQSKVSRMAMEFARVRDIENFAGELRQNSEAYPDLSFRDLVEKVCAAESRSNSDRAQIAAKNLLLDLQKEKV